MEILVTGVSGFVGAELVPRLQRDGHVVRGFSRDPRRVHVPVRVVAGDAGTGAGLDEALRGVEVAYYLIHAMEASGDGSFAERERRATENFAHAARRVGVRQVIYLGGLVPAEHRPSAHLASRLAVEETLLREVPGSTAFRASIVIGAHSRSFRFLVRLIERLPVLALPGWRVNRTQPIDARDVLELLARAAGHERVAGRSLDIGGPDVLTYGHLIERIRDLMLLGRPSLKLGSLTATPFASRVAAIIAGEDHALIGPLMEGLEHDLLPRDDHAARELGVRLHSFDAAVERALRMWEGEEELSGR